MSLFTVCNVCLSDPVAVSQYLKSKSLSGVQGFVSLSLLLTDNNMYFVYLVYFI